MEITRGFWCSPSVSWLCYRGREEDVEEVVEGQGKVCHCVLVNFLVIISILFLFFFGSWLGLVEVGLEERRED